jgi:hypothetical protein
VRALALRKKKQAGDDSAGHACPMVPERRRGVKTFGLGYARYGDLL